MTGIRHCWECGRRIRDKSYLTCWVCSHKTFHREASVLLADTNNGHYRPAGAH